MAYKLLSHPDLLLKDHLTQVFEMGMKRFNENNLFPEYKDLLEVILLFHDLGKASMYFQNYLVQNEPRSKLNRHSEISALWAYSVCLEELHQNTRNSLFAYACVIAHHSDLKDFREMMQPCLASQDLVKISEYTDYCELNQIFTSLGLKVELTHQRFLALIDELKGRPLTKSYRKIILDIKNESWIVLDYMFSLLIWADKFSAIFKHDHTCHDPVHWKCKYVDNYKQSFIDRPTAIDQIRNQAYTELPIGLTGDSHLYSINLPTGTGKTISSIKTALKLKQLKPKIQRIIYCLPFMSIIDQNQKVFEDILNHSNVSLSSDLVLAHHHLSDLNYQTGLSEYSSSESEYLIETWDSELIITTFAQLLNTCLTVHNCHLKRFHRLANSIIILDEVQNIPHRYWPLIKFVFNQLVTQLRSYLFLVTATLPLIFDENEDCIIELARNKEKWFKQLDRISIDRSYLGMLITIQQLASIVVADHYENPQFKRLIILNTIKSSLALYNLLSEQQIQIPIIYLSSNVIPKHRLERIDKIRKSPGKAMIIVSTQVVEAGVDIDVDVVYRDLAPLDSIIQASGRCNRNDKKSISRVFLFQLSDEVKPYWKYIYDDTLVYSTLEALSTVNEEIPETDIYQVSKSYYQNLKNISSADTSKVIIKNLAHLNLASAVLYDNRDNPNAFRLYDSLPTQTFFIELDDEASELLRKFKSIDAQEYDDQFQKRIAKKSLIRRMSPYMIDVPSKLVESDKPIHIVENEALVQFYNIETGFIRDTGSTKGIFL